MAKEIAKIYYRKADKIPFFVPEKFDLEDYALVCEYPIFRVPGHKDSNVLDALFRLFNWVDEGFQPEDPVIGFNRPESVRHTSMSVGDVVVLNDKTYICEPIGWEKVEG